MLLSDFIQDKWLKLTFGNAIYTPSGEYYVGLSTQDPSSDASTNNEPSSIEYSRVNLTNNISSSGFVAVDNHIVSNSGNIEFPMCTGDAWGTITHCTLWDAMVGGNLLFFGELSPAKSIRPGDEFQLSSGDLHILIDQNTLKSDLLAHWAFDENDGLRSDSHGSYHLFDTTDALVFSNAVGSVDDIVAGRSPGAIKLDRMLPNILLSGSIIQVYNCSDDWDSQWVISGDATTNYIDITGVGANGDGGNFAVLGGLSHNSGLNFQDNSFSISTWSNLHTLSGAPDVSDMTLLGIWNSSGDYRAWRIYWNGSEQRYMFEMSLDGTEATCDAVPFDNLGIQIGEWHHLVATYDMATDQMTTIIDNGYVCTGVHVGGVQTNNELFMVGADGALGDTVHIFSGLIDDTSIWLNRVLSFDEVSALYGDGTGLQYSDYDNWQSYYDDVDLSNRLQCYWNFDGDSWSGNVIGATTYDLVPSGVGQAVDGIIDTAREFGESGVYLPGNSLGVVGRNDKAFALSTWIKRSSGSMLDGLVSWWNMGNVHPTGGIADIHSRHHLNYISGNQASATTVPGILGQGLGVNITGGYERFEIPHTALTDLMQGFGIKSDITLSFWLYPSGYDGTVLGMYTTHLDHSLFKAQYDNSTQTLQWYTNTQNSGEHILVSSSTVPSNTWTHVVCQYSSTSGARVFVSGDVAGTLPTLTGRFHTNTNTAFTIGSQADDLHYFSGAIDEVGLWNRILHPAEVAVLYENGAGLSLDNTNRGIITITDTYSLYTQGQYVVFATTLEDGKINQTWGRHQHLGSSDKWLHIVAQSSSGNPSTLYLNGKLTSDQIYSAGDRPCIDGDLVLCDSGIVPITIDETAYWYNTVLTTKQIGELYNNGHSRSFDEVLNGLN